LDGIKANFKFPQGLAVDQKTGDLFVSDSSNHVIRKITPQGEVSTIAGSQQGFKDGSCKEAKFNYPRGIFFHEPSQSLLVCDRQNNKLRRIVLNEHCVQTICEIEQQCYVTVTANNTILVSNETCELYKINQQGDKYEVTYLAGNGRKDRTEESVYFSGGIAVHEPSHSCFVADREKINRIYFY